jgi:RNA polymerase sigma-70 factor (ECF subfamily)
MSPDPDRATDAPPGRRLAAVPPEDPASLEDGALMAAIARGDEGAFAELYDRMSRVVYGVVRKVVRDPSQSDEVTQEVFVEVWRTATRFAADRGSVQTWVLTMAHRRAIDRVRSEQASRDRTERVGHRDRVRPFDEVSEHVQTRFEHQQVRAALEHLTDLQREAIELAFYGGHTYREVAELLDAPLGTVKTRMRDGLIRLRDAMGVTP